MTDFQAAQTKRPDLVEATIQLGVMKLEAGNATEATPLLEMGVKFAPTDPIAHLNLGDCYRLAGRTADAKRERSKLRCSSIRRKPSPTTISRFSTCSRLASPDSSLWIRSHKRSRSSRRSRRCIRSRHRGKPTTRTIFSAGLRPNRLS